MIYLDNNATTPIDSRVFEAMTPFLTKLYGNPSSLHRHGRFVRTAIDQAREQVAKLAGTTASQVFFSSGGTEANNLAISGVMRSSMPPQRLLVGATEHPSVLKAAENIDYSELISVDSNGQVSAHYLEKLLSNSKPTMVSLMLANNETGVEQDIKVLCDVAKQHKAIFHTDAVQAAGKIRLNFDDMQLDLMTLSSHKIYGPKGIGALCVASDLNLQPMLTGGEQESALRPGTENVAGIIGFGMAAELALNEFEQRQAHIGQLQTVLESGLKEIKGLNIIAENSSRIINTTAITLEQTDGEMLLMQLDQRGIAISSGSACSSNSKAPSPVLKAMGLSDSDALSSVRISLGKDNTLEEVERFLLVMKEIQQKNTP